MDGKKHIFGGHIFNDSNFKNNTSECGTFLNISHLPLDKKEKILNIQNSIFTNNTASKFGGVIYSIGENTHERIIFNNCEFDNNHAQFGNIIYAQSKDSLPSVGSLNSNDVSTIPAYFEKYGNKTERISILSGESIPEGIMCKFHRFIYLKIKYLNINNNNCYNE